MRDKSRLCSTRNIARNTFHVEHCSSLGHSFARGTARIVVFHVEQGVIAGKEVNSGVTLHLPAKEPTSRGHTVLKMGPQPRLSFHLLET